MDLRTRAEIVIKDCCEALSAELSEEDTQLVAGIIERAMREAIKAATEESSNAARACCGADEDMAHQITDRIEQANTALISNLSSLR